MTLADIYGCAKDLFPDYQDEYDKLAFRVATCGTWLEFNEFQGRQSLRAANFCQLRLCPMCTARRARRAAHKLSQVMDAVQAEHPGTCYLFLTLTVENVQGDELGDAIEHLCKGWNKLLKHREVERAVPGWFRAVEITRNPETQEYHPHIHAILAVDEAAYFAEDSTKRLYISHDAWVQHWKTAARLDYKPWVDVRRTYARYLDDDTDAASGDASVEAAKYATKPTDYIDQMLGIETAAWIAHHYTQALRRRRLTAYGGWLKETAARLDADDLDTTSELIHADEDYIRDDVAESIAVYGWNLGAGDYILARREKNAIHQRVYTDEDGEDGEWVSGYELGLDE